LSPDVDSFSDTELVNLTGMPSLGPLQDTHSVHQHQMFPTIYSTAPTAKYDAVSWRNKEKIAVEKDAFYKRKELMRGKLNVYRQQKIILQGLEDIPNGISAGSSKSISKFNTTVISESKII